jgi:hypothetical protein
MTPLSNAFNILIFMSYVTISICILFVYFTYYKIKTPGVEISLTFVLWFLFVLTCSFTHLSLSFGLMPGHLVTLIFCTIFSVPAAFTTVKGVRVLNCFIASQVAIIEIFKCDDIINFMSVFDAVCTVISDGSITSGTVAGVDSNKLLTTKIKGALRPGNVVQIDNQYIRIACSFDKHATKSTSVRDLLQANFPSMNIDIEQNCSIVLIIGKNVTAEWITHHLQTQIADAKLSLALTTAHDLRTPLMNMDLIFTCFQNTIDPTLYEEALLNIEIMKSIISQTVDVGKLVHGKKLIPNYKWVHVDHFVKKVKILCKGFENEHVPIRYEIDHNFPKYIFVDSDWLVQIAVNLLSNACKYTVFGEIIVRIPGPSV